MQCNLRLPVSDYDRVFAAAQKHRVSLADVVRAGIRVAFKQQQRLDE